MHIQPKTMLVPALLGAGLVATTAQAESYSIENLTDKGAIVIQENWVHAPINLKPGEKRSFKSVEFSKQTLIWVKDGKLEVNTYYAVEAPKNNGKTVWKGNWNWQVDPRDGLIRTKGW